MGLFSSLFSKSKHFDTGYLKQIMHMNGQRTSLSVQINSTESFPVSMRRSKNLKMAVNNEIRNTRIFFGTLDAKPERIKLIHPKNHFEAVEDFDHSFELTLTLENEGGRLVQYCTYLDLTNGQSTKFEIKRHTVHNV